VTASRTAILVTKMECLYSMVYTENTDNSLLLLINLHTRLCSHPVTIGVGTVGGGGDVGGCPAMLKPGSETIMSSRQYFLTIFVKVFDGWAATFGTARRVLGGLRLPVPSSLYQL